MSILDQLSSAPLYLISGVIILYVLGMSVFFLIRASKAGIAIGMDKVKLRRTITSSVTFSILRQDFRQVQQLAGQAGCELERGRGGGLPSFLGRFRKRYAFLAGFGLSLLCVAVLSNVILRVQVDGNYSVPTAQI